MSTGSNVTKDDPRVSYIIERLEHINMLLETDRRRVLHEIKRTWQL